MAMPESAQRRAEVAYYYPAPYWRMAEADWLRSFLLFFDRIAILLPRYIFSPSMEQGTAAPQPY
jgi:hypothetical protein